MRLSGGIWRYHHPLSCFSSCATARKWHVPAHGSLNYHHIFKNKMRSSSWFERLDRSKWVVALIRTRIRAYVAFNTDSVVNEVRAHRCMFDQYFHQTVSQHPCPDPRKTVRAENKYMAGNKHHSKHPWKLSNTSSWRNDIILQIPAVRQVVRWVRT